MSVAGLAGTVWQEVEALLLGEKQRVAEEIASYPPPIPACDVQFNDLLVQRAELGEAVWRWRQIVAATAVYEAKTFLTAATWLDGRQRESLLGAIGEVEQAEE